MLSRNLYGENKKKLFTKKVAIIFKNDLIEFQNRKCVTTCIIQLPSYDSNRKCQKKEHITLLRNWSPFFSISLIYGHLTIVT